MDDVNKKSGICSESELISELANCIGNLDLTTVKYKKLEEDNAIYIWEEIRGGRRFIIDEDKNFLAVTTSAIKFEEILEEFRKGTRNGSLNSEFEIKISEYTVSAENEDSYGLIATNQIIQINGEEIKENVADKVKNIQKVILDNIQEIKRVSSSKQSNYKGGRQKRIDIEINNKKYYIIGNTNNEEAVKLYYAIKEEMQKIV